MGQLAPTLDPRGLGSHTRSGIACKALCPHAPKWCSILNKAPSKTLGGVHTQLCQLERKALLRCRQAEPAVRNQAYIGRRTAGPGFIAVDAAPKKHPELVRL